MRTKLKIWIPACALLAAAVAAEVVAGAQDRSVNEGIYTEAQVKRGAAMYKEQCAACHGDDLKGNDIIPGLTGDAFAANWRGKSLGDLFDKIQMTMPALNPGSLTPAQTADLVAHMLNVGKYPVGTTDLPSSLDALQQIKIDAPKN